MNNTKHYDAMEIIKKKSEISNLCDTGISERQASQLAGIPKSTLYNWKKPYAVETVSKSVLDFFGTHDGFAFLNQLYYSILFAISQVSKSGIRIAQIIFELSGLSTLIGGSYGSLQKTTVEMENEMIEYEGIERSRLSELMPEKEITICQDESAHKKHCCLEGIEPISNFILTEAWENKRDAQTWNEASLKSFGGLPIKIIQSTSDEGRAINKHREIYLNGAHHSPDLYHILNELHKATAGPLGSKANKYQKLIEKVNEKIVDKTEQLINLERKADKKRVDNKINKVKKELALLKDEMHGNHVHQERIESWRSTISQAIAKISACYHPYNIETGQLRSIDELGQCLNAQFDAITIVTKQMGLSDKCHRRIRKARKLIPQMLATVAFYFSGIELKLQVSEISIEAEAVLYELVIPAQYLEIAAHKMQKADNKHEILSVCDKLNKKLKADERWTLLGEDEQVRITKLARSCAGIFQRSSSCVEGRNSHVSLWHHGVNHLSPRKRKAITIVHNYFIKRADGTTAAEQFFGKPPMDIFKYLLTKLPYPARPRSRVREVSMAA